MNAKKPRQPKVTYRQEGGDDGYCYVLRVDGIARYTGLTRRQAQYEKEMYLRDWTARNLPETK